MNKQEHSQIVSFIWNIANDVLVHIYNKGDYRKIILPMIVIRRFDAVLEESKTKVLEMKASLDKEGIIDQDEALMMIANEQFVNTSPFTLKDLTSRTNQQQLKLDFIAYLDGFFSIANITDEERDLIGKAKRAITTGKFQQLQRDVNKLRNATKKTPINPVVLLEQLMKIITVYPLESVKMYDNIQQTVNVKQKKELHPEIIISESFNI